MAPRPTPTAARTSGLALLALLLVAVLASGCSSGAAATPRGHENPHKLATEMATALATKPYTEVNGSVSSKGTAAASTSITVSDVVASKTASAGTVSIVGNPTGTSGERFSGTVRYVVADHTTWVLGSSAFWRTLLTTGHVTSAVVSKLLPQLMKGWIELIAASTTNFNNQTAGLIDPKGFAEEFLHTAVSDFTNKGNVLVGGRDAVKLVTRQGATVDVAATGMPLLMSIATQAPSPVTTNLRYSYPASASIEPPKHFQFLTTILAPFERGTSGSG
jgi:hypothetical protein